MSRKTLSIILLLLILCSCKKEKPEIPFEETIISATETNFVSINIPKAIGNSRISEKINSIIENRVNSYLSAKKETNTNLKTLQDNIDLFNKDFKKFKLDFPESPQIWEAQIDGEVLYQTNNLISISITSYINTGGAHGNLHISLLNFNTATGTELPNENIFNNLDTFKTIAETFFYKAIKTKAININNPFTLPENIGFNENGVILLYNIYEIAPYSSGIIEFTIPYADIEPVLAFDCF